MKIIISVITTLLLLLFIFMIIYLFPDRKKIENFSVREIMRNSITIEQPINDSFLPHNPYLKVLLNEYEVIQTFKYIVKRSPTIPEINKFIYYPINELKEYLYNTIEYEKLIKIQDNAFNNGLEAAIAKKNLINRIMNLYNKIYDTEIPVKMILPLRDCFIYLQLNIYLFMCMLEHGNYSFFEDSVLSSYVLTKKVLMELFNKFFNPLELKIHAEDKINKLTTANDYKDEKYLATKIDVANIIKDLIVVNNEYLLVKVKNNYPNVFTEILKNTIGIDKFSINNDDIIKLKKYLSDLYNSSSSKIIDDKKKIKEKYENTNGENINGGYASSINNSKKTIYDYYVIYKKNKDADKFKIDSPNFFNDFNSNGFLNYLRYSDYSNKMIFLYYDNYKMTKNDEENIIDINNKFYYIDISTSQFDTYLSKTKFFENYKNDFYNSPSNSAPKKSTSSSSSSQQTSGRYEYVPPNTANTDLPFKNNYMNDVIYDEDNKSVLRLYNPIVHNKSYLLPSGYRPPVCTSLGQEQLTQPVFTDSKLLFQGLDINKAFTETQVGSIMPKFIYNEFKDIRIK